MHARSSKTQQYLSRTGSSSTRGKRNGLVDVLPPYAREADAHNDTLLDVLTVLRDRQDTAAKSAIQKLNAALKANGGYKAIVLFMQIAQIRLDEKTLESLNSDVRTVLSLLKAVGVDRTYDRLMGRNVGAAIEEGLYMSSDDLARWLA